MKRWTKQDIEFLVNNYPLQGKAFCATFLDRTEGSIRQKTSDLKLTLIRNNSSNFHNEFQVRAAQGKIGRKHSEETKKKMSIKARALGKKNFSQDALKRIGKASFDRIKNGTAYRFTKSGWFTIGRHKKYFRSTWEVLYARYLEWLKMKGEIMDWEYEPDTFWFESIRRGVRSYTPDFKVISENGHEYHEVKGYLDSRSKTKLKRMAKYHPKDKVILIDKDFINSIKKYEKMYPEEIGTFD